MKYEEVKRRFYENKVFSLTEIRLLKSNFSKLNLINWKNKGYIKQIKRGWYVFTDLELEEKDYFLIANKIYPHSYISLEKAFSYYDIIPERVYNYTSVTPLKTKIFQTDLGVFKYQTISPSLNWGYRLIDHKLHRFKIAELEKAILDYLYLNPEKKTAEDFEEMRFYTDTMNTILNIEKFNNYVKIYKNDELKKRQMELLKYIQNA